MNYISSDVSTIGLGICASMAAFLLSSGKKGKRYLLPNSEVMIHQPLGGVKGQATEIKIASFFEFKDMFFAPVPEVLELPHIKYAEVSERSRCI